MKNIVEALEEAAKKCDKIGRDAENDHPNRNMGDSAFECAAAIRALAAQQKERTPIFPSLRT